MKTYVLFVLAAVAALPARSAAAEETSPVVTVSPGDRAEAEMAAKGKALYAQHCSHCHGFNMVNPGTVTYDLRQFPREDRARFVHSVTQGKNGRMPQWRDMLSAKEIDDIWAYVRTGGTQ